MFPNQSVVVLCLSVYLFRHRLTIWGIIFLTALAPWDRCQNHQI
nr:MAG TPA: hypothetical protein [Bacteriophage sp.]